MTSTIAKVVRKKDHRDRYIGALFRTSEPVTMIPDRHMRRPEIVEKIRKAMSVVTPPQPRRFCMAVRRGGMRVLTVI